MFLAVGSVAVTVGAAAYYVGLGVVRSQAEQRVVALRRSRAQVLEQNFAERALAPVLTGFGRSLRRITPAGWARTIDRKIELAGWAGVMEPNAWAAIKALSTLAGAVLWVPVQSVLDQTTGVLALPMLLFLGFFAPNAVMNRTIDERREQMRRQLPDIIDLLVISVEAGLGFEAALARVVETVPGEMSDEFARLLQETRVGVARRDAMAALAARTDLDELDSFLLAMAQAESFGVSIARVLRVQSEEMRVARRQRAQERAFAAPVKMVFPMVICILPAIFVVLIGPALIQILEIFD